MKLRTTHFLGDPTFDWVALYEAGYYIQNNASKWLRLFIHINDKYGTIYYTVRYGINSLHGLIYPCYIYNQFPKWLFNLDVNYIYRLFDFDFLQNIIIKCQKFFLKRIILKACEKWPTVKNEILDNVLLDLDILI